MKYSRSFTYRVAGIWLLVVVVWVSVASYIVPKVPDMGPFRSKGIYQITSERDGLERAYEGPVYYEYSEGNAGVRNGPVFKLHFLDAEKKPGRGFGFVIPLYDTSQKIARERYKVSSGHNDFTHQFHSVFGYADLMDSGGQLFFTETGDITIDHVTDGEVAGELDLWFLDAEGNGMLLKGRFSALPLYLE